MDFSGCYYISIAAKAFGWTQVLPIFMTFLLFAFTLVSYNYLWLFIGLYLYPLQYFIFEFQSWFSYVHVDPVCQQYHSYAFPSVESFYWGGLVGIFLVYTIYNKKYHSWIVWFLIYIVTLVLPLLLLYTLYNTWWQVLFSMSFGFCAGLIFVYVLEWFIKPKLHYLSNSFPMWHLGYVGLDPAQNLKVYEALRALDQ